MEKTIAAFLDDMNVGPAQAWKNLTLFPLLSDRTSGLDYLLLDEALEKQCVTISEISEGGSVPELIVDNRGGHMLLMLDGEELVGARQNRVINTTILVAAGTAVTIPVSCCEQGRWSYNSPHFSSENRVMSPRMRAFKSDQVRSSLKSGLKFQSDQSAIWEDIAERADRRGARSHSMAMAAIYEKEKTRLEDFRRQFHALDNQVGAILAINGAIVGADMFSRPETFAMVFGKLIDSYALDAIDWLDTEQAPTAGGPDPAAFIAAVKSASAESHPSVALGRDIRFESDRVNGFALIHEDTLLHLSSFARFKEAGRIRNGRMQRFSSRRARGRS
ncbi:MAG: DUF6569 family protein [Thermodesulfobacteriota bacterium]